MGRVSWRRDCGDILKGVSIFQEITYLFPREGLVIVLTFQHQTHKRIVLVQQREWIAYRLQQLVGGGLVNTRGKIGREWTITSSGNFTRCSHMEYPLVAISRTTFSTRS